jgi:hypothetical protein
MRDAPQTHIRRPNIAYNLPQRVLVQWDSRTLVM